MNLFTMFSIDVVCILHLIFSRDPKKVFNFYGQQNQSFLSGNKVTRILLKLVFQTGINNGEE